MGAICLLANEGIFLFIFIQGSGHVIESFTVIGWGSELIKNSKLAWGASIRKSDTDFKRVINFLIDLK